MKELIRRLLILLIGDNNGNKGIVYSLREITEDLFITPIKDLLELPGLDTPILADIVNWITGNIFGDFTIVELMFTSGLFIYITYQFIKWLIGIVTGS